MIALAAWLAPQAASAQHTKEIPASAPAATAHTTTAAEHAAPAAHPEKTAAPAKAAPKTVEVKTVKGKAGETRGEGPGEAATTKTAAARAGSREMAPKKDDLKGALDRIDLEIAEMKKAPRPARATAAAATPAPTAAPRVKLLWRTALSWPAAIGGTEDEAAHEASHAISLTWR